MDAGKAAVAQSLFTPISSAHNDGPLCSLLQIGKTSEEGSGFNILLDCGWTDELKEQDLEAMVTALEGKAIDCVLISGSSIHHMGALPYLVEHIGLSCPIFSTHPVKAMGHITLYDVHGYLSERTAGAPFKVESIDRAMGLFETLKFFEKRTLKSKDTASSGDGSGDVFMSPHSAGGLLGACLWYIVRDGDEISYAPSLNHKAERHLPAAELQSLHKANLCILGADSFHRPVPEKARDKEMIQLIMTTLRRDGNVLIPVDATGRVLELMLMLEEHWLSTYGDGQNAPYQLVFYSEYAECTVRMAEQALEFTSENLRRTFETKSINCLSFASRGTIKFCKTPQELEDIGGAKVVFATPGSSDTGYALDLILSYSTNNKNTILLTDQHAEGTVTRDLMGYAGVNHDSDHYQGPLFVKVHRRVELTPEEMDEWRVQEQRRLDAEHEEADRIRRSQMIRKITDDLDSLPSDSEGDDDDEGGSDADAAAAAASAAATGNVLGRKKEQQDERAKARRRAAEKKLQLKSREGLFLPESVIYSSKHLMFPCIDEPHLETDGYGEDIEPDLLAKLQSIREQAAAQTANLEEEEKERRKQWEEREPERPKSVDDLEPPKKYEEQLVSVDVAAKVVYIPYEGKCDGSALKHIVKSHCQSAQQIIVVHASQRDTEDMVQFCENECPNARVHGPSPRQMIDVTSQTQMFRVGIHDGLYSHLDFVQVGDYQIATIEGVLIDPSSLADTPEAKRRCASDRSAIPVLSYDPTADKGGHPATYVGDLPLRAFSAQLRRQGFKSEFKKGSLLTNKQVCSGSRSCPEDLQLKRSSQHVSPPLHVFRNTYPSTHSAWFVARTRD